MPGKFARLADREPDMVRVAQRVAARLEGYSKSIETVLEELDLGGEENNTSFCHELDRLVFCCTKCDYWFNQTENANPGYEGGDWMCRECKQDGG